MGHGSLLENVENGTAFVLKLQEGRIVRLPKMSVNGLCCEFVE